MPQGQQIPTDLHKALSEKNKNNGRMSAEQTAKDLKEIMDQIPDKEPIYHVDDFSPRKWVLKKLSRSTSNVELLDYLMNYYGMSHIDSDRLIKACRKELNAQIKTLTETVAARNVKYLYDIVDECLDQKIYDTAINAIKELNKMSGVTQYNPGPSVTIAKNKQGEEMINITFDS